MDRKRSGSNYMIVAIPIISILSIAYTKEFLTIFSIFCMGLVVSQVLNSENKGRILIISTVMFVGVYYITHGYVVQLPYISSKLIDGILLAFIACLSFRLGDGPTVKTNRKYYWLLIVSLFILVVSYKISWVKNIATSQSLDLDWQQLRLAIVLGFIGVKQVFVSIFDLKTTRNVRTWHQWAEWLVSIVCMFILFYDKWATSLDYRLINEGDLIPLLVIISMLIVLILIGEFTKHLLDKSQAWSVYMIPAYIAVILSYGGTMIEVSVMFIVGYLYAQLSKGGDSETVDLKAFRMNKLRGGIDVK